MFCACRTSSLRIFVQSLTELRVADSSVLTSTRFTPLRLPVSALGHATYRPSTRSFSSTPAIHLPRHAYSLDLRDNGDQQASTSDPVLELDKILDGLDGLGDAPVSNPTDPNRKEKKKHQRRLERAKAEGAILDFNTQSLDDLVASLKAEGESFRERDEREAAQRGQSSSKRRNRAVETKLDDEDDNLSRRPKPEVGKSQILNRLKASKDSRSSPPNQEPHPNARKEDWQVQKAALKEKFPDGWQPRKRLSPDALDGIRALHKQYPEQYTTQVLAKHFEISAEAVRRILRSKWTPSAEEEEDRSERWFRRGKSIWANAAELGKKPPRKWRAEGIVRDPKWNVKRGARNYWPYDARAKPPEEVVKAKDSPQRKFAGKLL